jgi:DNA-binding response OmpR family regulator
VSEICNVLVVEDHAAVRATLGEVVEHEGYHFTLVDTAAEARRVASREHFDVAIVDVTLPGEEDGLSLASYLASRGMGILLISGNPAQFERMNGAGYRVLPKPFRLAELTRALAQVLEESGADCKPEIARRGP